MIIGSLTTISCRINYIYQVIESLYNQTMKIDKVYLFISKESFLLDEGITTVPNNLQKYIDNNFLIIEYVKNHGPYRKFIPILQKFKNEDIILTFFDDDWIYPKMLIEKMFETFKNFQNNFISMNAPKISYDSNGYINFEEKRNKKNKKNKINFKDKTFYNPNEPRLDLWTNNGYGVMFKSNLIQDEELFNSDKYLSITPEKDEVWWNAILKKNKIKIVVVDSKYQKSGEIKPLGTKWHEKDGLYRLISSNKSLSSDLKWNSHEYKDAVNKLKEYYKI